MNKVKKFLYSQKAAPYVFILPFVLTVILFWVFPIANGVLLSFQKRNNTNHIMATQTIPKI